MPPTSPSDGADHADDEALPCDLASAATRAEAPMRRISAMRRVRPATTVAKVFAVTIAAT